MESGRILVVDDNAIVRKMLARALEDQGYDAVTVENGRAALELLCNQGAPAFDIVLLDVVMPEMDGYETLAQIKKDERLHHIPVIMISALDEMDSVIRSIELGATDYLPKPFNPALLRARLKVSLAEKRLRDLELEYLEQVNNLTRAAGAVEADTFEPEILDEVVQREDALGSLARVFQRMAAEVHLREQRLRRQLEQLRLDIEEMKRGVAETPIVYIPMDRRQALAQGADLPDRMPGAVVFADLSGSMPLTDRLAHELGLPRGAEELTRMLNRVYGVLIDEVHRFRGSVIGFSGDAITCWFGEIEGNGASATLRAVACALSMQAAMARFLEVESPGGTTFSLAIKAAVASGPVRRFLVGDPQIQFIEVIAGRTLDRLELAERQAKPGEVILLQDVVAQAGERIGVQIWRKDGETGQRFAVASALLEPVPADPWPELAANAIPETQARQWVLPAVFMHLQAGGGLFLSELRQVVSLFMQFSGIDYEQDDEAGGKLDEYIRWVQAVLNRHEGSLIQLTMGDKGSYLGAVFGAPVMHTDDPVRAVLAALELRSVPEDLAYITGVQIGIASGQMRSGSYGSPAQRTFGVLGDKVNLAARLMQSARGDILCDEITARSAESHLVFESLPPFRVKGKSEPVKVYRPTGERQDINSLLDRLSPSELLTLKVGSVIGNSFHYRLLEAIFPLEKEKPRLASHLDRLERSGLLACDKTGPEAAYEFKNGLIREATYNLMLFAQRRHLHRLVAEWYERNHAGNLAVLYPTLAEHWQKAEDFRKAIDYLEKAGQQAMRAGSHSEAERYLKATLALDAQASVLSPDYYQGDWLNPEETAP